MTNLDKSKTHKEICVIEDKSCPDTLGELFDWVQDCIQKYGKEARVALETPRWEDSGHSISVYQLVPKTKDDLEAEAQVKQRQELQQRLLYERLKKLYD